MMYCTTRTISWILYILNLLCALFGILLLLYGTWLLKSTENLPIDHGEQLAAITIIVLASAVLLTTVFGFVAGCKQSKCMLIGYAVVLMLLLLVQLILLSISYAALSDGASVELRQGFEELWNVEEHNNNGTLSQYEEWLQCCGKNSAEDYFLTDKIPPSSCCKDHDCANVLNLYLTGCEHKFRAYIRAKTSDFNIISWLLIILEFSGSVATCILIDSIRNHRDRRRLYT